LSNQKCGSLWASFRCVERFVLKDAYVIEQSLVIPDHSNNGKHEGPATLGALPGFLVTP
jgi:hypothetical protein